MSSERGSIEVELSECSSHRLRSEFATVVVVVDDEGNGTRLAITDVKTGRTNHFDPLELEALAWISHDEMTQFMDPQRRWSDSDH